MPNTAIKVLFFGQLAEQCNATELTMENVKDTDQLINSLKEKFPILNHGQYQIAVDKAIIHENTLLNDAITIALLPPYAGG